MKNLRKVRYYILSLVLIFLVISLPVCLASNTETYAYDANGNLQTGDGYYRIYNEFNQLSEMREGNNASAPVYEQYFYDANGIRMLTIQNRSGAITKIYTPTKEMMRISNSSGVFDYRYIYAGDKLVARHNPDGSKWFYHNDHLESTSLVTDENQLTVEDTFYSPLAEIESGGTQDRKLYTGHEHDDTGQIYMKSRYYKPGTGQFISPDKVVQDVFNPQDWNHYSYVRNNAYKYRDPDGRNAVFSILNGVSFVVVASMVGIKAMRGTATDYDYRNLIASLTLTGLSFGDPTPASNLLGLVSDLSYIGKEIYDVFTENEVTETVDQPVVPNPQPTAEPGVIPSATATEKRPAEAGFGSSSSRSWSDYSSYSNSPGIMSGVYSYVSGVVNWWTTLSNILYSILGGNYAAGGSSSRISSDSYWTSSGWHAGEMPDLCVGCSSGEDTYIHDND